ncbi:MAG: DUF5018 domain-containing protein [Bacteroidales bacterium]|jgi:hypothetical protein|nr:DUF5018 domain-containing protein [Bacteroidales bacterium]
MKTNIFLAVLLTATTVMLSCKSKDDAKSSSCNIESFKVGNDTWEISGTNITHLYPKGTTQTPLTPVITVSDKATVSPASGVEQQDFFTASGVRYTVTAEDGSTQKVYTAKATVSTQQ